MALSDELGNRDSVRLDVGGARLVTAEKYHVETGIFAQPSSFAITTSLVGGLPVELFRRWPPNTPARVLVGGRVQFEGRTDGEPELDQPEGGDETLTIHGRDLLAPIHDTGCRADTSYEGKSVADLVELALKDCGIEADVVIDNAASRKTRAGAAIVSYREPKVERKSARRAAHIGETWYQFLLREAAHAGLFVWAAPPTESGRPCFVVSRPNTEQRPLYRLVRAGRAEEVSILACRRRNDTAKRFGQMIVVGRGGGRRYGNTKHTGVFDDPEMAAWGLGKRRHVTRDPNVTTDEEARLYAARKLAESQRAGWSLKYTVAGHTTPALGGGGVAVWTPDTTVLVDDARTGDAGIFWLESVAFVAPPTRTELTLFKPAHLTFGADA